MAHPRLVCKREGFLTGRDERESNGDILLFCTVASVLPNRGSIDGFAGRYRDREVFVF